MNPYITLGIETSCDETGAAIYHSKQGLLAHALFSQIKLHKQFGGVVPELASRSQLEKIAPVITQALEMAHVSLDDINVIAVTNKPGLPGSLLVGLCFAKAVAWARSVQLIGVDHLEGHVFSSFLEHDVPFPHLCLTASGGHTSLYLVQDFGTYTRLGQTTDDAAGEAFDKVAKLLELPYPGGPEIEKLASSVNFEDFFKYPRQNPTTTNFSFSGLKTAVLYNLVNQGVYDMHAKQLRIKDRVLKEHVASSLLVCIADIFIQKIQQALKENPDVRAVTFVGGVACNKYICERLRRIGEQHTVPLFVPSPSFCTDNGAMIAFVGNYKAKQGKFSDMDLDILR